MWRRAPKYGPPEAASRAPGVASTDLVTLPVTRRISYSSASGLCVVAYVGIAEDSKHSIAAEWMQCGCGIVSASENLPTVSNLWMQLRRADTLAVCFSTAAGHVKVSFLPSKS